MIAIGSRRTAGRYGSVRPSIHIVGGAAGLGEDLRTDRGGAASKSIPPIATSGALPRRAGGGNAGRELRGRRAYCCWHRDRDERRRARPLSSGRMRVRGCPPARCVSPAASASTRRRSTTTCRLLGEQPWEGGTSTCLRLDPARLNRTMPDRCSQSMGQSQRFSGRIGVSFPSVSGLSHKTGVRQNDGRSASRTWRCREPSAWVGPARPGVNQSCGKVKG